MATISVSAAPASGVEWKTFNATVTVTRGPFDIWTNGTINIYLKYGGVTVYSDSYFHNSNTSISYIFGIVNGNPLIASYPYIGATIEASFVPNTGGTVNTIPPQRTINITAATAVFSGGPFSRAVKEGCRWTEELVTVTMQDSGVAIPGFGAGYTYSLTSADGITFKDAVGGSTITSITFTGGTASFAICMNDQKASAVFRITNASDSNNYYDSDAFAVLNPSFAFTNVADASSEATAYDTRNNTSITASNQVDAGVAFSSFPDTGWAVSAVTAGAVNVTNVSFSTGGVATGINLAYQGIRSGVVLQLTGNGCSADSPSFNIIVPVFSFTGNAFTRAVPRFFAGESGSMSITARNKSAAVVTALPASNWKLDVLDPDGHIHNVIADFSFTSGTANPALTYPIDTVGLYTFTSIRTGESSLTGSSPLMMASQIMLNTPLVSGDTVTITGIASNDGTPAHSIKVEINLSGAETRYLEVDTNGADGSFTGSFSALTNGAYTVTVKESDDPVNSTENSSTFSINVVVTPPMINAVLDDNGTTTDLDALLATDALPIALNAVRSITVTVTTTDATPAVPQASLTKPDGTNINFNFAGGLTASLNKAGGININGVYVLSVNNYTDNSGTAIGFVRRFVVAELTAAQYKARELEGWGYYPREEGSPLNVSEQFAAGLTVPGWIESGAGTAAASLGNKLVLSVNNAVKNYTRTYGYIFNDDGHPDFPGRASCYIEAGVSVSVTNSGTLLNAFTDTGEAFSFYNTGAGVFLRNGAYHAKLLFIEVAGGAFAGRRIALKIYDSVNNVYILSNTVIDWSSPFVIRLDKFDNAGVDTFTVKSKTLGSSGAFNPVSITIPAHRLPNDTANAYESSSAGFGILNANGQQAESSWEFVRYAFYDNGFAVSGTDTYQLGLKSTQIQNAVGTVIEPAFYRSQKILVNSFSPTTENQPITGTNTVSSLIFKNLSAKYADKDIPVKVRFILSDWNDTTEDSVVGFSKAGFKNYYETYMDGGSSFQPYKPLNTALRSTIAFSHLHTDGAEKNSGNLNWDYVLDNLRLKRRIFILAVADAPLLDTPVVVNGGVVNDYIIDDGLAKTDFRSAARQFLPDFYIRDNEADTGFSASSGSASPDILSAVFAGNGEDFDPNSIPADGQAATAQRFPASFARGVAPANVPGQSYKLTKDQKAGDLKVILGSGWADTDAANDYFNRVWVRISNRGIVPGPARVQVFYGDATTRTDFVPSLAQDEAWEKLYGKNPTPAAGDEVFYQDRFVFFDAPDGAGKYALHPTSAIPALSGNSTPGASKSYTLADFKWYIPTMPPAAKKHGCLTGYINHPDCTSDIDNARRWDGGALSGTASTVDANVGVFGIAKSANNVAVRNYNIVACVPGSPVINPNLKSKKAGSASLKFKITKDNYPFDFRESPVNYRFTAVDKKGFVGLRLDGRKFSDGDLVVKIPSIISSKSSLINFIEISDYEYAGNIELNAAKGTVDKKPFRFYLLKREAVGEIRNLLLKIDGSINLFSKNNSVNLYFRPDAKIKTGEYEVKVEETINGEVTGGYITMIQVMEKDTVKYFGDDRYDNAYAIDKALYNEKVLKYSKKVPFAGPGHVVYNYFALSPFEKEHLTKPDEENELANLDKKFLMTKSPLTHNYNFNYSITAKVVLSSKSAESASGLTVKLIDPNIGKEFIRAVLTDKEGYFTINFTEKELAKGFSKESISADAILEISDWRGTILDKIKIKLKPQKMLLDDLIVSPAKETKIKNFMLHGVVCSGSGNYKDILIKAYDKDIKSADDLLGESWLTQDDEFEISFDENAFNPVDDNGKKEEEKKLPYIYFSVYKRINGKIILVGKTVVLADTKITGPYTIYID